MAEPGNRSLLRLFGIETAENRNTLDFYRRRQQAFPSSWFVFVYSCSRASANVDAPSTGPT